MEVILEITHSSKLILVFINIIHVHVYYDAYVDRLVFM